jgi:hypothetical protein
MRHCVEGNDTDDEDSVHGMFLFGRPGKVLLEALATR